MSSAGMKRIPGAVVALTVAALVVAGCGGDGSSNKTEPAASQAATSQTLNNQENESADGFVPSFSEVKQDKGPVFGDGCLIHGDEPESGECAYGDTESSRNVVVFGDSHALQWTPALIGIASQRGWRLTALLHANCTAAQVSVDENCDRWRENSLKRISEEKPGLVIVASNTGPNMTVVSDGTKLDREAAGSSLEAGMARTFEDLKASGAEVTLMQDMAMSKDYLPSECVAGHQDDPGQCTFEMDRPPELAYDLKAARQVGGVQVIDPLPKICPGYSCYPVHGRYLKFRDRFHITATYSRLLAPWLDSRLQNPWEE
ncbi:MAG TPA: SGNH hydrolase domain-containing protein [Solirubrobacterales bacterium]|nr:hypothetical protein [Solirubrobacterales bacterium]HMU25995.1 SGNH hydrolase domain-containing protein [Solirubrobacterales bacterium]HMX70821.1 SGNH hydrolase domain-containing protein [Solirubrobacterales bacterium]HMY25054.1 SGNH hydrolase domain-containing protein [Solirubrobacterales bacterium]HNA24367.1 SGNH hydrolase domain-containing protein [Solirubrobacterales bacterium]